MARKTSEIRISLPSRRILVALLTGVLVLVLAYFFLLIPSAAGDYREKAESRERLINEKLTKVYESFNRPVFSSAETEVAANRNDIKVARDAIKDTEAELSNSEKYLTGLPSYPLAQLNSAYRSARDADEAGEQYLNVTRTYLADYKALLDYADQANNIQEQLDKISGPDSFAASADPESYANALENAINQSQGPLDQIKALSPPESIKAYHQQQVALLDQLFPLLRQYATAYRNGDVAGVERIGGQADEIINRGTEQDKVFYTKLHQDSELQKKIDQLKELHNRLTRELSEI